MEFARQVQEIFIAMLAGLIYAMPIIMAAESNRKHRKRPKIKVLGCGKNHWGVKCHARIDGYACYNPAMYLMDNDWLCESCCEVIYG